MGIEPVAAGWIHLFGQSKPVKQKVSVAAIAPWFRLRLPSCGPEFESQAHQLRFFQFVLLEL